MNAAGEAGAVVARHALGAWLDVRVAAAAATALPAEPAANFVCRAPYGAPRGGGGDGGGEDDEDDEDRPRKRRRRHDAARRAAVPALAQGDALHVHALAAGTYGCVGHVPALALS